MKKVSLIIHCSMAKLKSSLAADLRPHSDMSKSIAKTQSISCCIFASEAMRPILQLRLMQPVLMSLKMCFNIVKKWNYKMGSTMTRHI